MCAGRPGAEYEGLVEWAKSQVGEPVKRTPLTYGEQFDGPLGAVRIEDRRQIRDHFMEGRAGEPSGEMLVRVLSEKSAGYELFP